MSCPCKHWVLLQLNSRDRIPEDVRRSFFMRSYDQRSSMFLLQRGFGFVQRFVASDQLKYHPWMQIRSQNIGQELPKNISLGCFGIFYTILPTTRLFTTFSRISDWFRAFLEESIFFRFVWNWSVMLENALKAYLSAKFHRTHQKSTPLSRSSPTFRLSCLHPYLRLYELFSIMRDQSISRHFSA